MPKLTAVIVAVGVSMALSAVPLAALRATAAHASSGSCLTNPVNAIWDYGNGKYAYTSYLNNEDIDWFEPT
jgi:hypothetical protein